MTNRIFAAGRVPRRSVAWLLIYLMMGQAAVFGAPSAASQATQTEPRPATSRTALEQGSAPPSTEFTSEPAAPAARRIVSDGGAAAEPALLAAVASPSLLEEGEARIFGPARYVRTTGPKNEYQSIVDVPAWIVSPYRLLLVNGEATGENRVSSGWVDVNGTRVVAAPEDFNQGVATIEKPVSLTPQTTLDVVLSSKPASYLSLYLFGRNADHAAPQLSITPAHDATVNDATPRIVIAYADAAGAGEPAASGVDIASLSVLLDGVNRSSLFTRRSDEASAEVPASLALSEGLHTLQVTIRDKAGNQTEKISTFRVDLTPPSIHLVAPAAGAYLPTRQPQLRIAYADDVAVDLSTLEIRVNDVDRTGSFTTTPAEASWTADALPEGANRVTARIRDRGGNEVSTAASFNVDVRAPQPSIQLPSTGGVYGSAQVTVSIGYTDDQALDLSSVALLLDGSSLALTVGPAGITGTTPSLADGPHSLQITIADRAGNAATATSSFRVDTDIPVVKVLEPAAGAYVATAAPAIAIEFSDATGVDWSTKAITINGIDQSLLFTQPNASATARIEPGALQLPDGVIEVVAAIRDLAANLGRTVSTFTVDTIDPVLQILLPGERVSSATPAVSLSYADSGSGIDPATVRVHVDGVDRSGLIATGPATASGTLAVDPILSEGPHQIRAVVADRAGNATTVDKAFIVDTIAPLITFVTPSADSFVRSRTPLLKIRYGDGAGTGLDLSTLRIFLTRGSGTETDVTTWFSAVEETEARGQVPAEPASSPLGEGTHRFRATVNDLAGNRGEAVISFEVDTIAPVYLIEAPAANGYVATALPQFRILLSDDRSGFVAETMKIFIDGEDRTEWFEIDGGLATAVPAEEFAHAEGVHEINVTLFDRAGNQAEERDHLFTVDTIAPVVTVAAPVMGTYAPTAQPLLRFLFDDSSGSGIDPASVAILIDGVDRTAEFAITPLEASATLATPLGDGSHTVRVSILDWAGNPASATSTFGIDTVAPVVSIDAPAEGSFLAASTSEVSGAVFDASPVTVVVSGVAATVFNGRFTAANVPLPAEGEMALTAVATDAAGNRSEAVVRIAVDRTIPVVAITEPLAGAYVKGPGFDVKGTIADASPVVVEINGLPGSTAGGTFTGTASGADGPFVIDAAATDAAGNVGSAQSTVTIDSTAPVITVSAPAAGVATSATSVEIRGTIQDLTPVSFSIDGAPVALGAGGSFSWEGALGEVEGPRTFALLATDAVGLSTTRDVAVTIDRTPPQIQISTPAAGAVVSNLPVVVRGTYADATAVVVQVNGVAATLTQGAWEASFETLPEGAHTFTVRAVDAAGNETVATRSIALDLLAPVVTIASPAGGSFTKAASATITGTIADFSLASVTAAGVAGSFTAGEAPGTYAFTILGVPLTEGDNSLRVVATDRAERVGEASVAVTRDSVEPTVTVTAPLQITRTKPETLTVAATDNIGVVEVGVALNGTVLATFTEGPYELDLSVPEGVVEGDVLTLTVNARDAAGNVTTVVRQIPVVSNGVVVGQVLADETGLPIEGAFVGMLGDEEKSVFSDASGRYSIAATDMQALLAFQSPASSSVPVERQVSVASGVGTVPVDARLTALGPPHAVGPGGATIAAGDVRIELAPGAVPAERTMWLTPLSPQGLPNLLPLGWSPVAAFDLRGGDSFEGDVTATIEGLPSGIVHLVSYRAHTWIMVAPNLASNGTLVFPITAPGSFAIVVADSEMTPPEADAIIGAAAMQPLPEGAISVGGVTPAVLPPTGGRAIGSVAVQSPSNLPSGTVVRAEITETFSLASGDVASEETRPIDIILYRAHAPAGAVLGAEIPIVPSKSFAAGELVEGRVHLDILSGREPVRGKTGGSQPVTVTSGPGAILISGGSLDEDTAVSIDAVPLSAFLPTATSARPFAELLLDLSGRVLSVAAELSVVAPEDALATETFLVARVERVLGVPRVVVVDFAEMMGTRIVSAEHPDLPGIREGGRYVFYRSTAAVGLLAGVTRASTGPIGALVQTDGLPFVALSGADGVFVIAAREGAVVLSATVPATSLAGSATAAATGGMTIAADVLLQGTVTTAHVTPANGSAGVPVTAQVEIAATAPIAASSLSGVRLFRGPIENGQSVALRYVLSGSGMSVAAIPQARLEPATQYTLQASGLVDVYGSPVSVPLVSFTTRPDTPPQYDLKKLVFGMPDANGIVRFTAPAGALPPGTTVLVVNAGTGIVVSFTAGNDGSLAGELPASIDDRLLVTITDPLGSVVNIERSKFEFNDGTGRVAIGAGGGEVEGPGGVALRIPEGAFDEGVVFKVEAFGAEAYPERPDLPGAKFGAGLRITAEGMPKMKKEGDLVFPKPADAPEGAFYYVYRRITGPNGQVAFETIDHAFAEGDGADAKVVTASYPFIGWDESVAAWEWASTGLGFGVADQTLYYMMWTYDASLPGKAMSGVITGQVYRPVWHPGASEPEFVGISGVAVVRTTENGFELGGASTFARTGEDGTFSLHDSHYTGGVVGISGQYGAQTVDSTAYQTNVLDTKTDPRLYQYYSNIAYGNITLEAEEPPPPAPEIEIRIYRKRSSDGVLIPIGGEAAANQIFEVGFRSNVGTALSSIAVWINGIPHSVRPADGSIAIPDVHYYLTGGFWPSTSGTYTIRVAVRPLTGAEVTVARTVLIVSAGEGSTITRPGAPAVIQVIPSHNAVDIASDFHPEIVFSEPVTNVAAALSFRDAESGITVPFRVAGVSFDANGDPVVISDLRLEPTRAVTAVTIIPLQALKSSTWYTIEIAADVARDLDPEPKYVPAMTSRFQSFAPEMVGESFDSFGAHGLVVLRDHAYVGKSIGGYNEIVSAYDISNPNFPFEVGLKFGHVNGRVMDVTGQEESSLTGGPLVIAASGGAWHTQGPSNLFIWDAGAEDSMNLLGVVSLTNSTEDGVIIRVATKGRYAFTYTFPKGIQTIDLVRAKEKLEKEGRTKAAPQYTLKGNSFATEAIVSTVPVIGQSGYAGRFYGIAVDDFVVDGRTTSLVLATGSIPFAAVDPFVSKVVSTMESITIAAGDFEAHPAPGHLERGTAIAIGDIAGVRTAVVGGFGSARENEASTTIVPGRAVVAIVDVSDPKRPVPLSFALLPNPATRIVIRGNIAIVGAGSDAVLIDLSVPKNPVVSGTIAGLGGHVALSSPDLVIGASTNGGPLRIAKIKPLRCADMFTEIDVPADIRSGREIPTLLDWTMTAQLTENDGLVLKHVTLGERLLAKEMSLPYFYLELAGKQRMRCELGPGQPCPSDPLVRSRLVALDVPASVPAGALGFAVTATYLIDRLDGDPDNEETPEAKDACVLVTQRYEFTKEGSGPCEASDELSCARFRPIVSYRYLSDPAAPPLSKIQTVQRFDFDPPTLQDQPGQGNLATLFADCEDPITCLAAGWSVVTKAPYGNPMTRELVVPVIVDGKVADHHSPAHLLDHEETSSIAVAVDNLHLGPADPSKLEIDGPTFTGHPGCPECVHIHWRWGHAVDPTNPGVALVGAHISPLFDNNDGRAIIPPGSNQDVEIAVTVDKPESQEEFFKSLANGEPIFTPATASAPASAKELLFWYSAIGHKASDRFFTHGGFFSSLRITITNPTVSSTSTEGSLSFRIRSRTAEPMRWKATLLNSVGQVFASKPASGMNELTGSEQLVVWGGLPFGQYLLRITVEAADGSWSTERHAAITLVPTGGVYEDPKAKK